MALTGKQQRFIDAYLANGMNATKAAREAGYKGDDNALAQRGYEAVRNREIAAEIARRTERSKKILTAQETMEEISEIALDKGGTSSGVRLKALETLSKIHGLHREKVEHEVKVTYEAAAQELDALLDRADADGEGAPEGADALV